MNLKECKSLYIGDVPIRQVFVGSQLIWPVQVREYYVLEYAHLYYSSGAALHASQSNYASIHAELVRYRGQAEISRIDVECVPVYEISPSHNEAIVTSGTSMMWDKEKYGEIDRNADWISVVGTYQAPSGEHLYTEPFRVDIGANHATITSYTYRKNFSLDITGNIPSSGGLYYFTAESYRTGYGTWTSGYSYTGDEEGFLSTLSCDMPVAISSTAITASMRGFVTFPENISTALAVIYEFDLYNDGGHLYETYEQDKSTSYFYIEPVSLLFQSEGGTKSITVHSSYPAFSVSGHINWASYEVSGNTIAITAGGPYTLPTPRTGSYTIIAEGGPSVILEVTQVAPVNGTEST